jgi:hypothetical protein
MSCQHLRVCSGPGLDQNTEVENDDGIGHESAVHIHLQRQTPSPVVDLVQHRIEIKTGNLVKAAKCGINSVLLLQTHINFPRFLPIFPDFLERLSHLAPIY